MYNPSTKHLISKLYNNSGKRNLETHTSTKIVSYGIKYFDEALYGVDLERGELIGIQADEKNRKTTTMLNIIYNIAHQLSENNMWICIDTLESGSPPETIVDQLVAILSTRLLISEVYGKNRDLWPSIFDIKRNKKLSNILKISKEFLRYGDPTDDQLQAIRAANDILSCLPISVFGASGEEGSARDLRKSIERWDKLYNGEYEGNSVQHRVFVCDNVGLYYGYGADSFKRLEEVIAEQANFIVTHPGSILITLSQLGRGSSRESKLLGTEAYAKGGAALKAESTVLIETSYNEKETPDIINIGVSSTRKRPPPDVIQEIDMESGAFLRPAYTSSERAGGGLFDDRRYSN